jgi:photosystem II stability/assembly factor-like uncharacterized protein
VSRNEGGNSGSIVKIYAPTPESALLLKFSGIFYATSDGGRSWSAVAALPEEPPQAFLGDFRVEGQTKMWTVGGADSIEGMWGTLARMNTNCSWTSYRIGGVWFGDAAVLSDAEFIAGGAIPSHGKENLTTIDRDGVILHSNDRGRNWTVLYQNAETQINAIAAIDSNNILAVGTGGFVIRLERVPGGN